MTKHYLKAVYHVKCDPKKTCINNSLFKSSKWTMLVHGAGAVWSRLFLSGVEPIQFSRSRLRDFGLPESVPGLWTSGVGSGTLDFRSRSPPKNWRLRNTGLLDINHQLFFRSRFQHRLPAVHARPRFLKAFMTNNYVCFWSKCTGISSLYAATWEICQTSSLQ